MRTLLSIIVGISLIGTGLAQQSKKEKKPWLALPETTQGTYLGRLSSNPYQPDSTSNSSGTYGSQYSPKSINNPYGQYGSQYSSKSANNPYSTGGPSIVGQDGTYLGRLNGNRYDPNSVSNPYGRYGSPYSPKSINNPYGKYGSQYSPYSSNNPYATKAPRLFDSPASGSQKPAKKKNSWWPW